MSALMFAVLALFPVLRSPLRGTPALVRRRGARGWVGMVMMGVLPGMVGLGAIAPLVPPARAAVVLAQAANRPTLSLGSEGTAVRELQAMLTLMGYYSGPVDGQFQAITQTAVEVFQRAAGLSADGIVGPTTWGRLLPTPASLTQPVDTEPVAAAPAAPQAPPAAPQAPSPAAPTPQDQPILLFGDIGPGVEQAQQRLRALGFYQGSVDGVFGPQTEAAVMAFQRQRGLEVDGVVGPATWRALLQP